MSMGGRLAARVLWGCALVLAAGGVFIVAQRLADVTHSTRTGDLPAPGSFEAGFAANPGLTALHILPGFLLLVLGPLQFVPGIRARHIGVHRWSGRILVAAGFVVGLSALTLGFRIGFGGPSEVAATVVFAGIFLFALGKAVMHIRRGEVARHREWMLRAFAVGLAVVTIRPIVALFFLFSSLSLRDVLGTAFWLAFTLHLIVAEIWINHTRSRGAAP